MPGLVNRQQGIRESLISVFLYGSEYWFLYTLFMLFVIAPAIEKCINNKVCLSCLIILALGLVSSYITDPLFIIVLNVLIDFYLSYIVIHFILSRIPLVKNVIGIQTK